MLWLRVLLSVNIENLNFYILYWGFFITFTWMANKNGMKTLIGFAIFKHRQICSERKIILDFNKSDIKAFNIKIYKSFPRTEKSYFCSANQIIYPE